jgi:soluble lytic murein transglycosylase-like protein
MNKRITLPVISCAGLLLASHFYCSTVAAPAGKGTESRPQAPHVPAEIFKLWHAPSPAFQAATAGLGTESRESSVSKLRRFMESAGGFGSGINNTERQAGAYALARLLAKGSAGEQNEAIALYAQAQALPPLRALSLWHAADIISAQGDEKKTREFIDRILRDPASPPEDQARALYETAQSFIRERDNARAKDLLIALKQKYSATEYATAASYYLGQMAFADAALASSQGSQVTAVSTATSGAAGTASVTTGSASVSAPVSAEGIAYFCDYLKNSTGGRFSQEVADRLLTYSGQGVVLTPADLDRIGVVFYKRNSYAKALTAFDRAGTGNNQFRKAQCLAKLRQKPESVAALLQAIKQAPDAAYYDDFADVVTGPLTRAETAEVWKKILALKPLKLDHALWNLAVRSTDQEARPLFRRLVDEYPTSEHAPESMWWMFWHSLKTMYPDVAKNKAQALSLANMAETTAKKYHTHRSAARFLFWSGKIHERLGDHARAKAAYQQAHTLYPANYYAARALARVAYINAPPDKKRDRGWSTNAQRQSPDNWNWPGPPELFNFDRIAHAAGPKVAVLAAVRQMDECLTALGESEKTVAAANLGADLAGFKAWLLLSQGNIMDGIRAAGKDLDGRPDRSPLWQINYPWAYAARIKEQGQIRNVDPYLIHALIREESRYFPKALSRSNAIGLMQLLPGTGYGVAKRIGVPLSSKEDIFIPDNNIKLGTAYLEYTLKRFNGNAMLAVASYNGGPNAVKSWVDKYTARGGTDYDYFVEEIPFRETRDYVRKVFGSYFVYETLY